jgi:CheY-like chemotaxis protein
MHVLIAEDDDFLRELLTDFLTELCHEVKSVRNGHELVRSALGGRPDLIITDLHMPDMNGRSMIAMLDMYPDLSGIPLIVISGATARELLDMEIPKTILILPKPFNFAMIIAELGRVVQ